MRLHENINIFKDAIRFTAQELSIKDIYVEKDYWVTFALYTIFHHEIGEQAVFKGGTALSKCHQLIDRFSEDIDLVVLRDVNDTPGKLTRKIKEIGKVVSQALPEIQVENITHKKGMNRKTAHSYGKEFSGNYGQVRDVIIVEASWLGDFEPYSLKKINSYVFEMMAKNNQQDIAEKYGLLPFEVKVLDPSRTLCEKIMSLVRFSYNDDPLLTLKQKIRHTYDLHKMLENPEINTFLHSPNFEEMLLKVAENDVKSFKNNNEWLAFHPLDSLLFKDVVKVWKKLAPTYNTDFRDLVYGPFPSDQSVLDSIIMIRDRMKNIRWKSM